MKEIKVVSVAVAVGRRAAKYPYHELRIVEKDVDGGHYANSKGCKILKRSGPRRGSKRLRKIYEQEAEELNRQLHQKPLLTQELSHE